MTDVENLIGIMADSHGRPESIEKALDLLASLGCKRFYHLGDVCDSMKPETADACVDLLVRAGVRAIKGNNDHAVVVNQWGMHSGVVTEQSLRRLKDLPPCRVWKGADFAHSMPFIREMGLSAMIGAMNEPQILMYFSQNPEGLFFRGHSHEPALAAMRRGRLSIEHLKPGDTIHYEGLLPCVVTCGALTRGYATVWDTDNATVQCLSFR